MKQRRGNWSAERSSFHRGRYALRRRSSRLERVLNGMDGVQSATVSLAANSATVVPDPALSESDTEALVHQIEERAVDMGFTATPVAPEADMVDTWEAQQKETVGQLATLKARLWPEFGFTILLLLVSEGAHVGLPLPAITIPCIRPSRPSTMRCCNLC